MRIIYSKTKEFKKNKEEHYKGSNECRVTSRGMIQERAWTGCCDVFTPLRDVATATQGSGNSLAIESDVSDLQ